MTKIKIDISDWKSYPFEWEKKSANNINDAGIDELELFDMLDEEEE